MLVHLRELALVAVQLHELPLAGNLAGPVLRFVDGPDVAFLALAGVGGVAATERRQASIAHLPHPVHSCVQEGAVV